jgi:hypothetical protein
MIIDSMHENKKENSKWNRGCHFNLSIHETIVDYNKSKLISAYCDSYNLFLNRLHDIE